ncbi:hypothetical protein Rs2_19711 [Raphanus sativus]|nr:hypothetical protein Rs2_19711 [Raphanus sativus]
MSSVCVWCESHIFSLERVYRLLVISISSSLYHFSVVHYSYQCPDWPGTYPDTDVDCLILLVVFLAGSVQCSGVSTALRYAVSRPLSPLGSGASTTKKNTDLARSPITSYFGRRLGDSGIQGNKVKPTSPGLTSIEENGDR